MFDEVAIGGGFILSSGELPGGSYCFTCKKYVRSSKEHHLHSIGLKQKHRIEKKKRKEK